MKDYKKEYEQAFERAKNYHEGHTLDVNPQAAMEYVFPELKESEDEKMRNHLLNWFKDCTWDTIDNGTLKRDDIISWLEKQCEQKQHLELKAGHWYFCHQAYCERADILTVKEGETFRCEKDGIVKGIIIIKEPEKYFREISAPIDKVEPKFKVGDWVVIQESTYQITKAENLNVTLSLNGRECIFDTDVLKNAHLWTIQDAKDGDVLANKSGAIFINAGSSIGGGTLDCYCYISVQNEFCIEEYKTGSWFYKDEIKPATQEQRGLLFSRMKEAGYEWDAEKKKLKKIEQEEGEGAELTNFESALFSAFSDAWQEYLSGKEVNVEKWAKEHSAELLEVAREQKHTWSEEDKNIFDYIIRNIHFAETHRKVTGSFAMEKEQVNWLKSLKEKMKGE